MEPKDPNAHDVIYPAGNDTYHAVRPIDEFGELAHAAAYALQLMRDGKVHHADEALSQATAELRRVRFAKEGYNPHLKARRVLQSHTNAIEVVTKRHEVAIDEETYEETLQ